MPPKSARPAAAEPVDGWSSNPYKVTDPRHAEFESQHKNSQREAMVSRLGKDRAKQMRVADFVQHSLNNSGVAAAVAAAPPGSGGQTTRRMAAASDVFAGRKINYPSKLHAPVSRLERTIPVEGIVCSLAVQGGALVWCFCRDGMARVVNGFTGDEVASFSVLDDIEAIDDELQRHQDADRQASLADRLGGLPPKKVPERHTKAHKAALSDANAYVISATPLGDTQLIAALRSDNVVRVFDVISMSPVVDAVVKDVAAQDSAAASGGGSGQATPFGTVLLIEALAGNLVLCVVQEDSACVVRLSGCNNLFTRPVVEVLRRRTYDRLNLKFTAACTDDVRTLVYACDSKGSLWWIDIEDLLVVDSLVVVPPESGAATPSKRTKKTTEMAPTEYGTAVAVFKHWVVSGTDKGTLAVFASQSLGEKPHVQMRRRIDESAIVSITPDERTGSVWVTFSDGRIASWTLKTHELAYSVCPPINGTVVGCTIQPNTITNKIWTATTSGINHVFITETNLPLEQMLATQHVMNNTLNHQREAVAIKEGEVQATEETAVARLHKIVNAYQTASLTVTMRQYLYKWLNYKVRVVARRNREATADCLSVLSDLELGRVAYLRLVKYMNINRARKQVLSMVSLLLQRSEEVLQRRYYTYLQEVVKARKSADINAAKCRALLNATENATRASVLFNQLSRYSSMRRSERERVRYAVHQSKAHASRTIAAYFNKWFKFHSLGIQRRRAQAISARLLTATEMATRAHYYSRFSLLSKMHAKEAQRTKWVETFAASLDNQRRLASYALWRTFRSTRFATNKAEELKVLTTQKSGLDQAYVNVAPKAERKKLIAKNNARIEELKRRLEEAKEKQMSLNSSCASLAAESVAKVKAANCDSPAAPRLELLTAFSALRGASFQFHKDGPAIAKVADKAKKHPSSSFSSAWFDLRTASEDFVAGRELVKKKSAKSTAADGNLRTVETATEESADPTSGLPVEWAVNGSASDYFTLANKASLPSINSLIEASKRAVIVFDLLSAFDLQQLRERDEVLANVPSLVVLIDAAMSVKTRAVATSAGAM